MFLCARYPCTCSVAVHAPEGYLVDKKQPKGYLVDKKAPARPGRAISPRRGGVLERLVIYCQTTGVSAAHATHCATYCTPYRPLVRAFSGWIRTPPPTSRHSRGGGAYMPAVLAAIKSLSRHPLLCVVVKLLIYRCNVTFSKLFNYCNCKCGGTRNVAFYVAVQGLVANKSLSSRTSPRVVLCFGIGTIGLED